MFCSLLPIRDQVPSAAAKYMDAIAALPAVKQAQEQVGEECGGGRKHGQEALQVSKSQVGVKVVAYKRWGLGSRQGCINPCQYPWCPALPRWLRATPTPRLQRTARTPLPTLRRDPGCPSRARGMSWWVGRPT